MPVMQAFSYDIKGRFQMARVYNISSWKAVDYYLPQIQRQKNDKGNPNYCKEHGSYETHAESHTAVFYK